MKLWLISQDEESGYDSYDSAVVCAATDEDARRTHPTGSWKRAYRCWAAKPESVRVKYIGEAALDLEVGVVCASFNAG